MEISLQVGDSGVVSLKIFDLPRSSTPALGQPPSDFLISQFDQLCFQIFVRLLHLIFHCIAFDT